MSFILNPSLFGIQERYDMETIPNMMRSFRRLIYMKSTMKWPRNDV